MRKILSIMALVAVLQGLGIPIASAEDPGAVSATVNVLGKWWITTKATAYQVATTIKVGVAYAKTVSGQEVFGAVWPAAHESWYTIDVASAAKEAVDGSIRLGVPKAVKGFTGSGYDLSFYEVTVGKDSFLNLLTDIELTFGIAPGALVSAVNNLGFLGFPVLLMPQAILEDAAARAGGGWKCGKWSGPGGGAIYFGSITPGDRPITSTGKVTNGWEEMRDRAGRLFWLPPSCGADSPSLSPGQKWTISWPSRGKETQVCLSGVCLSELKIVGGQDDWRFKGQLYRGSQTFCAEGYLLKCIPYRQYAVVEFRGWCA